MFCSRSKTEDVESALIEDEDELQSKKKKGKKDKKKKGDIENEEEVSEITKDVQELSIKGKREKLKVIKYCCLFILTYSFNHHNIECNRNEKCCSIHAVVKPNIVNSKQQIFSLKKISYGDNSDYLLQILYGLSHSTTQKLS